jgi:signal transduction histidine kinase
VTDTGSGIEADKLDKVFEPGFTTKGRGVGTGLGLAICYQIVRDHEGDISVASEPGGGTTVNIDLPVDGPGRAV